MTTLREAAQAALALVNDTLLERTVDTKRLSAVGRDLEAALDAEPVVWMHPDGRVVTANTMECALRDGGAMRSSLIDYTIPLYTAPQPPADVPRLTDQEMLDLIVMVCDAADLEESLHVGRMVEAEVRRRMGGGMSEPVWIQSNHLQLARQGVHLVRMAPTQHQSDYIPLYTADAIREAIEAELAEFIDEIAPKHGRTSCSDEDLNGNQYPNEMGYVRCVRCALLHRLREGAFPYFRTPIIDSLRLDSGGAA